MNSEQFYFSGKLFSGDFTNIPNFPNLPNLPNLAGLNIQLPIHLNGINLLNPSANGKKSFNNVKLDDKVSAYHFQKYKA